MYQGFIDDIDGLNQELNLTGIDDEAILAIRAFQVLRQSRQRPEKQVDFMVENGVFVMYESTSKLVVLSSGSTSYVTLYWGIDSRFNLVISSSGTLVATACGSVRPFIVGQFYACGDGLWGEEAIFPYKQRGFKHNAMPEADDAEDDEEDEVDFDSLVDDVNEANFRRFCLYITSLAKYLPWPEDVPVLGIAYKVYRRFEDYPNALRIALYLDNTQFVKQSFTSCNDPLKKKQLCYIVGRHGLPFKLDDEMVTDSDDRETSQDIINNTKLSEGFLNLARVMEAMEPKSPEDIYKENRLAGASDDLAIQNLAATFVNAFVNAGFGKDTLMTVSSESSSGSSTGNWLFKNEEHGKISAAASLGMISLWDIDAGVAQLEKYLHGTDNHAIAGALLGVGIVNCGVRNGCDLALTFLSDYIRKEDACIRIGAILGLGIAYAGAQRDVIRQTLSHILNDPEEILDVIAFTSISLGLIYVGSCNEEVAQAIIFALMNISESELSDPLTRLLPLGLGLLYLGKQESVEATAEISKTFHAKIRNYCDVTLLSCAYAGTGNVLQVQKLLGHCGEHLEESETYQGPAVLGIAMISMAEEIGLQMSIRLFQQLLRYGEQNVRRAVPLALGLLFISNPKANVMETLSQLSHDADSKVAMGAVLSLGFIGAGTNNTHIDVMLRNLASRFHYDPDLIFWARIALGLVHLGKGLLTLNPYHSARFLVSPTALAGIVTVLHACLDMKAIISGKYHYVLYLLVLAMQPRMLLTVDEKLKPLPVAVIVGRGVDVVGRARRRKTITGFQTKTTPVLLAAGERAELVTEKYIPLSSILEGFVILKENPDYREDNQPVC